MRQPRPEPADPVNSANIDCVAVVIAPRIRAVDDWIIDASICARSNSLENNVWIEALNVVATAQSGSRRKQSSRPRCDAIPKRVVDASPLCEAPNHGAQETIAGADCA